MITHNDIPFTLSFPSTESEKSTKCGSGFCLPKENQVMTRWNCVRCHDSMSSVFILLDVHAGWEGRRRRDLAISSIWEKSSAIRKKNGGRGRVFVIALRFMRSPAVTFNLEGGKIVWKENNETMIFYSLGCCHPAWGAERWQNCWKLSLPHRLLQGCFAVFYTTKGLLYCRLR